VAPTGGGGVTANEVAVATGVLPMSVLLTISRAVMTVGVALGAVAGAATPLASSTPAPKTRAATTPIAT
jgi:hypothetical protein